VQNKIGIYWTCVLIGIGLTLTGCVGKEQTATRDEFILAEALYKKAEMISADAHAPAEMARARRELDNAVSLHNIEPQTGRLSRNIMQKNVYSRMSMESIRLAVSEIEQALAKVGANNRAEQDKPESNPIQQYLIGPGDILGVSVWNEPDLSKTVTVRLDKRISLPLIGDVVGACITLKDLTNILAHKFSKFISNPNVVVILQESKSKRYYLIGRVNQPGEFPLDFPLTVLQALARAGGFTEWADIEDILIIHSTDGKETIQRFNYPTVIKGKNLQQNINIQPGDTIVVP
jgi:polysaccharide export outer membrane protein